MKKFYKFFDTIRNFIGEIMKLGSCKTIVAEPENISKTVAL